MEELNVLFMGYVVSADEMGNLSGCSVAGNKMQLNVIRELQKRVSSLKSTTVYPVAAYPNDKSLFYSRKMLSVDKNIKSLRIPFINIPFLKQMMQIYGNYRACSKIVKAALKEGKTIKLFTFNMYPQVGLPAVKLKKKYNVEIVCLLADLPIDDNYSRCGIMKTITEISNRLTRNAISNIDKAIVLNENAWKLYAPQAQHIVVDGGIDIYEVPEINDMQERKRRNLLYSGALTDYSGIREVIEAVERINDNIELDIYGDGPLSSFVRSKESDKVHYYGKVCNEIAMQKQREAYFLINPRPVEDKIAQVTFPSKIFEYMLSGTPVISTHLNGFSGDYDDLIYFCQSNQVEELVKVIQMAYSEPYSSCLEMAKNAREYVVSKKVWNKQVDRMIDFMQENSKSSGE